MLTWLVYATACCYYQLIVIVNPVHRNSS